MSILVLHHEEHKPFPETAAGRGLCPPTAGTAQPQEAATAKASRRRQDSMRPTDPGGAGAHPRPLPPPGPASMGTHLIPATLAPRSPVDLGNFFIRVLQKLPGHDPPPPGAQANSPETKHTERRGRESVRS